MVLPLAHFAPGPRVAPRGVSTSRQLLSSRPAESLSTRRGRGLAVTRPIGSDFGDIGRHYLAAILTGVAAWRPRVRPTVRVR